MSEVTDQLEVDKARFEETRRMVLERINELRGVYIPVEILSIQNLETHNCLILNDLLLLNYEEARSVLEELDEQRTAN